MHAAVNRHASGGLANQASPQPGQSWREGTAQSTAHAVGC